MTTSASPLAMAKTKVRIKSARKCDVGKMAQAQFRVEKSCVGGLFKVSDRNGRWFVPNPIMNAAQEVLQSQFSPDTKEITGTTTRSK